MSVIKDIQTDLVTAVSSITSFAGETVRTGWVPDVVRNKLTKRETFIDPELRETKMISRGCRQTTVSMIIAMIAPHSSGSENDIAEAEQLLVDDIFDQLLGKRIGAKQALVEAIEQPVIADAEHWRQYRQATTMLRVRMVL